MIRRVLVLLVLVACGGESSQILSARFPLGPKQVGLAVLEKHPEHVDLDENRWKASAPKLELDVVAVRSAVLDVESREGRLRLGEASVLSDLVDSPFVKVELLIGPGDVDSVADSRVVAVADGAVPRESGEGAVLRWREGGESLFGQAVRGELGAQVAFFLRGTATLSLEPGALLPPADVEGHVTVHVPFEELP